jgi:uncharacterized protein
MIVAVLDTNKVVQAAIGSRHSASAKVVDALFEGRFLITDSPATLEELHRVLSLSQFVGRHGFTQDEIITYIRAVTVSAKIVSPLVSAIYPVRDITDREFLALTIAADADFLVTNDRRHLLPLKRFGRTRIVTPAAFLRHLK